jgi:hypothetical protein
LCAHGISVVGSCPNLVSSHMLASSFPNHHRATYAGIFTLLSYTACPCLLNIMGRGRMEAEHLTENKYCHTPLSVSFLVVGTDWNLSGPRGRSHCRILLLNRNKQQKRATHSGTTNVPLTTTIQNSFTVRPLVVFGILAIAAL